MEKIKVLVVDDDNYVTSECARVLNGENNAPKAVDICSDGQQCLSRTIKSDFDILLLDIALPHIDGLTVLERIPNDREFKVVVMSSMNSTFVIEKAIELGACYFLPKPIDFPSLPSLLARISGDENMKNPKLATRNNILSKNLDEKIANIFMTIGIPPHIKGYTFLREAIKLAVDKPSIISAITKELYPNVATLMDSTPSKVERAIRHAIDVAWSRGKSERLNQILGVKVYISMKPTNGEFIAIIADKLLLESI